MDDFFRSQQSPRGEAQMNSTFVSPQRNGPMLPRRFTTDSGRVPTLSSITTAQRAPEQPEFPTATTTLHKVQLLEKKRMDYERLREHKRRFEAEIHKLDAQQRQEERELQLMQEDLNISRFAGHQSEPTTPPEYRETTSGFPSMFSRPNRYSTSSLTSPPGLFNRPARSGSVLASPQSGIVPSRFAFDDQLPSRSVPGSRRNSDEDEKEEAVRQDPSSHRSTNALNRYSMPVTRSRTYLGDIGLEDSNNTTGFLFGDEDSSSGENRTTPTAQLGNSDSFSSIFRQQAYSSLVSNSTTDLASQTSSDTPVTNGWNKHRSQQSISTIGSTQLNGAGAVGGPSEVSAIGKSRPSSIRHSMDGMKLLAEAGTVGSDASASVIGSPASNHIMTSPPKLQQSYSTGDVPTVKNTNGTSGMSANANHHAQQHFHHHNATLGRIPAGAMPPRHSRELSNEGTLVNSREVPGYQSIGTALQAGATPFGGPVPIQAQSSAGNAQPLTSPASGVSYSQYYANPGYNGLNGAVAAANYNSLPAVMGGMSLSSNGPAVYSPQNYTGYSPLYAPPPPRPSQDSQARVIQSRRQADGEAMARYNNLPLEQVGGTIYQLCKDQHGCRYLQKQLENRVPEQIHMIWLETNQHVVELMTDPFGNYLCQKLLEYCNDEERTVLIQNAACDMVRIALNQHGTRALQKMIEHVSTPEQIQCIINALRYQVVELIQDLNGNHVIQKCLNKLSAANAAFIFEAVGNNCVEVGTHRHGCCVLQRCIDHADGPQKTWLIDRITAHAVTLVQDPFGNYVVQYIIDLNEETFTDPLVRQFAGRIVSLSKHKFSSNVVEKCLRCAGDASKDLIVGELLAPGEIDRLLRDSFANYVIQTALEYASPVMKHRLIDTIRPSLPGIRATPYGRRIQAKVQAFDARNTPSAPTQSPSSTDVTGGQMSGRQPHSRAMSNGTSVLTTGFNGAGNRNGVNAYPPSNILAVPPPAPQSQQGPPPQRNQPFAVTYPPTAENGETHWL